MTTNVKDPTSIARSISIRLILFGLLQLACLTGCSSDEKPALANSDTQVNTVADTTTTPKPSAAEKSKSAAPMAMGKMKFPKPADIKFKDDVASNAEIPQGPDGLVFLDTKGKRVALKSYIGKKNVVLVFTEGFAGGMLCPFCKTQTSRLIANYDKFAKLDTEILVVYPGTREHLDEFVAAAAGEKEEVDGLPFPLLLDKDLKAVGYFKITSNLAHPSTFIIDKRGNVRLAYVGADMSADRPSVASMLKVLESSTDQ